MNKISFHTLLPMLAVFCFLLSNCRTDPKIEEEPKVEYKRTVNEVIVSHTSEADNLNPPLTTSGVSFYVLDYLFQTLETIDPTTLELIPVLAEARPTVEETVENGEERTAYTFKIREEAVWDNGSPITSKDVEFSMKAILNPKVPAGTYRNLLNIIKDLIIYEDDPKKVTVVMEGKYIRNEESAGNSFRIMPAYHYDPQNLLGDISIEDLIDPDRAEQLANSNLKLQQFADEFIKPKYAREADGIVGSGPYRLKEWITGQRIVLEKKEDWWGEKINDSNFAFENNVDNIIYQPISEANAAAAAVKGEEIDVLPGTTPQIYKELKADENVSKVYDFFEAPRFVSGFWYINSKSPKLSDKRVRRALAHLVDVDAIITNVLDMPLTRIATPVLPSMPGYDSSLTPIAFDVEKAKALLKEAGWEDTNNDGVVDKEIDGERIEMSLEVLTVSQSPTQSEAALLVKEDAIQAGVDLEVVNKDSKLQREDVAKRSYDLATGATGEPTPWAYDPNQAWHTSSDTPDGGNRTGFGNAETDTLIEEIRTTLDENKRKELYKKFQRIIYDEQPMIFLYEVPNFLAIHKRFNAEVYPVSPGYFPGLFEVKQ